MSKERKKCFLSHSETGAGQKNPVFLNKNPKGIFKRIMKGLSLVHVTSRLKLQGVSLCHSSQTW